MSEGSPAPDPFLSVVGLTKHFSATGGRRVYALDDVHLSLGPAEVLAVVGESGSGKSTLARVIARLYPPTAGSVRVLGQDITDRRQALATRRAVQMVFQDPFAALNPVHSVEYHILRPMQLLGDPPTAAKRRARTLELLRTVGLAPPEHFLRRFPHELSGGQRQRVVIARALGPHPAILLADEPTSMLDVSIRVGVLNLLRDLVRSERVSLLYITHDLAGARYLAHRIAVLYAGRVVEEGPTATVVDQAAHPYTRLLLSSVPQPRGARRTPPVEVRGEVPDMTRPPAGCRFHPRCPFAMDVCAIALPTPVDLGGGHRVACHLYGEDAPPAAGAN